MEKGFSDALWTFRVQSDGIRPYQHSGNLPTHDELAFGLTNTLAVFQHMMNDIFREYLDHFVVIYLDDIPVFCSNLEEHTHHALLVLTKLREYGLFAKSEKCKFDQTFVEFLGYIISPTRITMDERKVVTITDFPLPTRLKEVQSFLGFANFNRRFIDGNSHPSSNLSSNLPRKILPFFGPPRHTMLLMPSKPLFSPTPC